MMQTDLAEATDTLGVTGHGQGAVTETETVAALIVEMAKETEEVLDLKRSFNFNEVETA
jgi:hypothetical protein